MVLGAIAMLAFGFARLGARRTLIFFAASCLISASAELTRHQNRLAVRRL